jgi:mono/diheme cytochrome c family protein/YHS domain-containing protein
MLVSNLVRVVSLAAIVAMGVHCTSVAPPASDELQKRIAFGEKVFLAKQCGDCHRVAGDFEDETAPNLSSVFLAMDTLYVKAHLQFSEVSAMKPIPLTPHEISAVTQYIASLHAKANTPPDLVNPDGRCPVCGAPVQISDAASNHLQSTYNNKVYHFECPDCKVVFERDPAWHSQSGYVFSK